MPPISKLTVTDISKDEARDMVRKYHYSGRVPGIFQTWGLEIAGKRVGCVVYSFPASYTLCMGVCGIAYKKQVVELSRLVINTRRKNAASFLIGESLRRLASCGDGKWIVVSYADCNEHIGHVGYVYQATNWIYTGQGNAEPVWLHPTTGEIISYTRRHIDQKALQIGLDWRELIRRKSVGKHRYVTFVGDRRFKREVRAKFLYKDLPYPKGQTRRHEGNVMAVLDRSSNGNNGNGSSNNGKKGVGDVMQPLLFE